MKKVVLVAMALLVVMMLLAGTAYADSAKLTPAQEHRLTRAYEICGLRGLVWAAKDIDLAPNGLKQEEEQMLYGAYKKDGLAGLVKMAKKYPFLDDRRKPCSKK